ncbi:MAG TPA: hypothetical protein VGC44_07740 [Longimicrobiales bacterium]
MKRSFKAFVVALLLALPLLSSCADHNPTGPAPSPTMQTQEGLVGDLLGGTVDLLSSTVKLLGSILTGPDANGTKVTAWIGSDGGTLKTAAYTLVVPRGAVNANTQFVIEPANDGSYTVNLYAYQKTVLGTVSVGEKGFAKPVLLTISYDKASGVTNERKIAIIYIESASKVELQNSSVDARDNDVTAALSHFSKYAMVQN